MCRAVIDAQILIRDNKVYMRKRCAAAWAFRSARVRRRGHVYEFARSSTNQARSHLSSRRNGIAAARSIVDSALTISNTHV